MKFASDKFAGILAALIFLFSIQLQGQVKIGAAGAPNANAVLELDGGTSKGLLLPKLTATEMTALATAPDGLMVYNKTDNFLYIRKAAAWQKINDATSISGVGLSLPYSGTASTLGGAEFAITHTTTIGDAVAFSNSGPGAAITTNLGHNKLNMGGGNTGIGLPSGILDYPLLAKLVVRGTVGNTSAVFGDKTSGVSIENSSPGIGFNAYYNAASINIVNGYSARISHNPNNGVLSFSTASTAGTAGAANDASMGVRMTINAAGNVGINTQSPSLAGLVVNKANSSTYGIFGGNSQGISLQANWPGIGFNEYYNNGSKFMGAGYAGKITLTPSNGEFNFYTTAASGAVDATASVLPRLSLTSGGSMTIQGPDNGYIFRDRTATNYSGWNWYANAGKASLFRYTNGGNTISIDSTGAIGLEGITAPTAPITTSNNTGNKIDFYYASPTSRYGIGLQGALLQLYAGSANDDIAFGYGSSSSFSEKMRIRGNGNVGIGITPTEKFEVRTAAGEIGWKHSWGANSMVSVAGTFLSAAAVKANSTAIQLTTNTNIGVYVNTAGNVGAGVINPSRQFDVAGRMRVRGVLNNTDNTSGIYFDGVSSPERSFIGTLNENTMGIYGAGSGWSFLMDVNDGALMIGTTQKATGYKVNVAGKVIAEEVRVQLRSAWPDYVFDNGYKKLSIDELEQYIAENKHLPNIPSAADIEKEGQQLGEVQRKMLEKIEELSLYIIDLKKEIDQMKAAAPHTN